MPQPFPLPIELYVGDGEAYRLVPRRADGTIVDLSDAAVWRLQASVAKDRLQATTAAAVWAVTATSEYIDVRLTPDESQKLGTLPLGKTGTGLFPFDLQVEELGAGGAVVDRWTWFSDDAAVTGDVTR